ncbi:MAG: hypothetical protein LUQ70_03910, partial [Methanobacteriaceae archaeon]|nr:hypothetical protein [Methanobacteriaceae archaeon]
SKDNDYPVIMKATVPSSASSVLGKIESPEPTAETETLKASPELISAVAAKTKTKKAPKKEVAIKKEGSVKRGRKPKDKGNDMLLS